ncbi:IclR family transcriptional regulator [Streptomyces avicenniae]|uniref:IclR family transcriptional regulator n=1 Tax=Streptomyces avicenniae TaxID=500153 RepID=UPI00069ABF46|nr:IclR family transcriptional regulator [Streptomyces avicenniae]
MPRTGKAQTGEAQGAPAAKHSYHIEALARGLAVLDAFGPLRRELTLKDVAEAARVTQPSALRIGYTLVEAGYLVRNPGTKGYRLGPRALSVGLATLGAMTLPEIAEPYLTDLRNRTQENIKLAVPSGTNSVVVGRVPSYLHPDSTMYIGSTGKMHVSSLGRAILAWRSEEEIAAILERVEEERLTARTLTKPDVLAELEATRRRGYAVNDQGTTLDHRSVAAPLFGTDGRSLAAVNLSMSVQRISRADLEKEMAPLVVETARAISAVLPPQVQGAGHFGTDPGTADA